MVEEEISVKIKLEFDEGDIPAQADKMRGKDIKEIREDEETLDEVSEALDGNLGQIQNMTTKQIGNVTQFARNPFQFITTAVMRRFTKGAGIAALALIIFEAVKQIVMQLFEPGRALDNRFRERIMDQILVFEKRKEQQELRQGFKQIITTTIQGTRGFALQGQVSGNFYNPNRIPTNFLDKRRTVEDNKFAQNAQNRQFFNRKSAVFR